MKRSRVSTIPQVCISMCTLINNYDNYPRFWLGVPQRLKTQILGFFIFSHRPPCLVYVFTQKKENLQCIRSPNQAHQPGLILPPPPCISIPWCLDMFCKPQKSIKIPDQIIISFGNIQTYVQFSLQKGLQAKSIGYESFWCYGLILNEGTIDPQEQDLNRLDQ